MSRDAWVTVKVAKDGSRNYGAASNHFMGEEGAFNVPVERRRMGHARQFALRVSCSSPTRIDFLAMTIEASQES